MTLTCGGCISFSLTDCLVRLRCHLRAAHSNIDIPIIENLLMRERAKYTYIVISLDGTKHPKKKVEYNTSNKIVKFNIQNYWLNKCRLIIHKQPHLFYLEFHRKVKNRVIFYGYSYPWGLFALNNHKALSVWYSSTIIFSLFRPLLMV